MQNDNDAITVHCISFGFKYGLPLESDLVFDVRCLPNPFYVEELREHTGLEAPVRDYVMNCKETEGFKTRFTDMIDYCCRSTFRRAKASSVIAVGCTGGHHRSWRLRSICTITLSQTAFTPRSRTGISRKNKAGGSRFHVICCGLQARAVYD